MVKSLIIALCMTFGLAIGSTTMATENDTINKDQNTAESQQLDLNYDKCLVLIKATAESSGVPPVDIEGPDGIKMAEWTMSDGKVIITCLKKEDSAIMTLQPFGESK